MDYDMLLSKSIKTKKIIINEDINLYKERVMASFNDSINNIHENEDIEECFNIYIQTLIRHYKKKDIIDSYHQDISMNQNDIILINDYKSIEPLNKFVNKKIKNFQIIKQNITY